MKFLSLACLSLVFSLSLKAQVQYELIRDNNGNPILKGIITRELLEKEPSYTWYAENQKGYTPNAAAVEALKSKADSIQLVVFMGTWCGDSHNIIPKFFSLTDAAGLKPGKISFIGVDRQKKTLGNLTESLNILNVPTIIVMKEGKEIGRVVEYGKTGQFDRELGEIVKNGWGL